MVMKMKKKLKNKIHFNLSKCIYSKLQYKFMFNIKTKAQFNIHFNPT